MSIFAAAHPALQHPAPGLDAAGAGRRASGPSWRWWSASSTRPCSRRSRSPRPRARSRRPYIQRNITATRAAYGLNDVAVHTVPGRHDDHARADGDRRPTPTLNNIRQWDPDPTISLQTFQRQQAIRSYYTFPSLGVDRYTWTGS